MQNVNYKLLVIFIKKSAVFESYTAERRSAQCDFKTDELSWPQAQEIET